MKRDCIGKSVICFLTLILFILPVFGDVNETEDTDGDGLPDAWEIRYSKGNLSFMDKNTDFDEDGISDGVEYQIGTDPTTPNPTGPGIFYEYDELGRIIKIERIPSKLP